MAKYKKIKPHQQFWLKVFKYIIENEISDPFGLVFYLTTTPANFLNMPNSLKKELLKFKTVIKDQDIGPETLAVLSIAHTFEYWAGTKRFLKQTDRILELLYNGIIIDFKQGNPVIYEELLQIPIEDLTNVTTSLINPVAWFFIDSILNNKNAREVNELLEKLKKEEEEVKNLTTLYKESSIIDLALEGGLPENDLLRKEYEEIELEKEIMLKIVHGEIKDGKLVLPEELLRWIIALVRIYLKLVQYRKELENQIERQRKHIEELYSTFRKEMNLFFKEHNNIIEKLHALQAQQEMKKARNQSKEIAQIDKYELEIAELKAKISSLQEERDYYSDLVEELKQQLIPSEEELKPLPKRIDIAYFGFPNSALETYLANFNIFMKTYSPTNPKQDLPDLPIVFNIDIASHKVYNLLKKKKPFLVSGSNPKKLTKIIYSWVKNNASSRLH